MQVETTNIIFDVASGGTIDIGGNVEALGNQSTALNGAPNRTTWAISCTACRSRRPISSSTWPAAARSMSAAMSRPWDNQSLTAGSLHETGFLHITQVETTDIIFNVANGGTIDIGGNVVASSTQQTHCRAASRGRGLRPLRLTRPDPPKRRPRPVRGLCFFRSAPPTKYFFTSEEKYPCGAVHSAISSSQAKCPHR